MSPSAPSKQEHATAAPRECALQELNPGQSGQSCSDVPSAPGGADIVLDHQGFILDCSEAAAEIFGFAAGALTGRHVVDLIPGIHLSAVAPKSNIDYAAYCGKWGLWHDHRILNRSGKAILVKVLLKEIAAQPHHLIQLSIREPHPLFESQSA